MFDQTLASLAAKPWAIAEEPLPAIQEIMVREMQAGGKPVAAAGINAARGSSAMHGNIIVIPVAGVLTRRLPWYGTSYEDISRHLQQALADPMCASIILRIDSGGGAVGGVQELGDEIFRGRSRKPIVAFVDDMAASAAYWIASQATEIIASPSGDTGSIGVLMMHLDISEMMAQAGIKPTLIHAGKHKVEANPYQRLSDEARAYRQAQIDEAYGDFLKAVARGRGVGADKVRSQWGQGRCLSPRAALALGMVDRIGTFADAVSRAATVTTSTRSAASSERHARIAALAAASSPTESDRAKRLRRLALGLQR